MTLGQLLVAELQRSAEVDTLARWMAHYLAELLIKAKQPVGAGDPQAGKDTSDLIISLWTHRDSLPGPSQPFREFKSVLQVMQSLDLTSSSARYFRWMHGVPDEGEERLEEDVWLKAMSAIDRSARLLIQFCIDAAIEESAKKGRDWIHAKDLAGLPDDDAVVALRAVMWTPNTPNPNDASSIQIASLQRARGALKAFAGVSGMIDGALSDMETSLTAEPEASTTSPRKHGMIAKKTNTAEVVPSGRESIAADQGARHAAKRKAAKNTIEEAAAPDGK